MSRVVVVGGGIAGLAAAWEITGGSGGSGAGTPEVVVFEASARLGGKLRSEPFEGLTVDVGPDGFLGRRPEGAQLCREVGLGDELEPIATSGAAVWVKGRRRTLPNGLVMGVPTRLWPTVRSRVLGLRGDLGLLRDRLAPRPDVRGPLGDRAVGPLVAHKLGPRAVDRLVEPMLGGIHAGAVADMSAAEVFPQLLEAAQRRGGLVRALRQATRAPVDALRADGAEPPADGERPPMFWTLRGGLESLVETLARQLTARGATIKLEHPVGQLQLEQGPPWRVHTPLETVGADAVVLAVPAPQAAALLAPHDADSSGPLGAVELASVAVVTLSYPADALADDLVGTGLLVPRSSPAPEGLEGHMLVTACSYLSEKWPHLAVAGRRLVRASVGRFDDERHRSLDDDALVSRVTTELQTLLGADRDPSACMVARWDRALPQYRVHHGLRMAGVEAAAQRLPCLALAGATYHGVGIPACIASGRAAARTIAAALSAPSPSAT